MLKMINQPRFYLCIVTGFVLAATYLIKASVIPTLIIFLGLMILKQMKSWHIETSPSA